MKRLIPDPDPRRILQFVIFGLPIYAAINYATSGRIWAAVLCLLTMAVLFGAVLGIEIIMNRANYYKWYVASSAPAFFLASLLFVWSGFGLSTYFDTKARFSIPGYQASAGFHVLLCIGGLLASAILVKRTLHRVGRLSKQRPLSSDVALVQLSYTGENHSGFASKSWRPYRPTCSQTFKVTVQLASYVDSLEAYFIALERIDEHGKQQGLVWCAARLAFLRPLVVVAHSASGVRTAVNQSGRLIRCSLVNRGELELHVVSDDESDWFAEGSRFRFVVYLRHGGYIQAKTIVQAVSLPGTAA